MTSLIIRKAGVLTTIQDLGRTGGRAFGINPGGAMDRSAVRILNLLIGNHESEPVIETHFPAVEIEFSGNVVFAIGGADFGAILDGKPIQNWTAAAAADGSVLRFKSRRSGSRAYVAVKHGLKVERWRGSASTNLSAGLEGILGRRLAAGDRIDCETTTDFHGLGAGTSLRPRYSRFPTVRIVTGSEFDYLTAGSERTFLKDGFTLTNDCDRMGYRLTGKPLHLLHAFEMVSSPVTFGTIQLLPDGQLIVLMADHQTTGGYPRIGNVIDADLPVLAQCGPGDGVSFERISIAEAEAASLRFEKELNFLRVGCRLQKQNASR